jgi:hypothetical protein
VVFDSKQLNQKNKNGLTAWAHRSVHQGGLTEPARPGSAAPLLTLSHSRSNPNPISSGDSRRQRVPRPAPASSGEIRRRSLALLLRLVAPHLLTAGIRRHRLPSPTSPPSSVTVDLALVARSAPVSLLELLPVLACSGGDLLGSASVGRPPQPRRRRCAVLCSAMSTPPPPRRCSCWRVAWAPQPRLRRRAAAMVSRRAPL